jgi:hypothetical protein
MNAKMPHVICYGCGNAFDSHTPRCPRCGRCPACGTRVSAEAHICPNCKHPTDEGKLRKLEADLDPSTPKNKKTARGMNRSWEDGQVMERIRLLRTLPLILVVTLPLTLAVQLCMEPVFGLPATLGTAAGPVIAVLVTQVVIRLMRKGQLQWLVRDGDGRFADAEPRQPT